MSITLDQVTKRYQSLPVVNDVSLEIGEGELLVLLGLPAAARAPCCAPSQASSKSTTVRFTCTAAR